MFKNLCGHGFLFCWCLLLRFLICFCVWVCDDNNFLSDLIGLFLFQSMPFSFWACFQSFAWSWLSQFVWGCNAWPIRYIVNYDSWSVSGARKGFVPANSLYSVLLIHFIYFFHSSTRSSVAALHVFFLHDCDVFPCVSGVGFIFCTISIKTYIADCSF